MSHQGLIDEFLATKGGSKSGTPTVADYRDMLRETLTSVGQCVETMCRSALSYMKINLQDVLPFIALHYLSGGHNLASFYYALSIVD